MTFFAYHMSRGIGILLIIFGALGSLLLLLFWLREWEGLPLLFWLSPLLLAVGIYLVRMAPPQTHRVTALRIWGVVFLVLGIFTVLVALLFRIQHWVGGGTASALAPFFGGLGAVALMLDKRTHDRRKIRESFRGDNF